MRRFVRWFIKITGFIPAHIFLKIKAYNDPNFKLPPRGRSAILICNHRGVLDVMLIILLFAGRSVRILTGELMYNKGRLFNWFLKMLGCIRVDRDISSNAGYLGQVTRAARAGELICIFPEGRFNKTNELLEFREGAAYIAGKLGLPIIPIYSDGAYSLFKRTRVSLGAPVFFGVAPDTSISPQWLSDATKQLKAEIQKLKNSQAARKNEEDLARREGWLNRILYRFTQVGMAALLYLGYRPNITYTDRAQQSRRLSGPVIVICNHVHMFDPAMLCTVFYSSRLHMLAAGEIFETNKFVAWTLRCCNCVRLDRSGAVDTRSFRECISLLKSNEPIGLFPEGHIANDGGIDPFMSGFLLLAVQTGAKVLPVCLSHKYKPFGKRLRVHIDTPIELTPPNGRPTAAWMAEEGERLRDHMLKLHKSLNKSEEGK